VFIIAGRGQGGSGQNTGMGFVLLKDWDDFRQRQQRLGHLGPAQ
jgi:hypothetical protein